MYRMFFCVIFLCTNILVAQDFPTSYSAPIDDVVEKQILKDRRVLAYPGIREADIMWEKRIWRVIDTREKMNLPFRYPQKPFINILMDAVKDERIKAYSAIDDKFTTELSNEELTSLVSTTDTVEITDPETYEVSYQVTSDDLNPEDIKKFRMKEVWFFDSKYSKLSVRILGIAPIQEVYDDNGNFRFEKPLFWIYYPHCREELAQHKVFYTNNDVDVMSWEDHLENRFFSSFISKESNVHDRRIEDYLTGVEALREGEKIRQEIFNFEHDLWSY